MYNLIGDKMKKKIMIVILLIIVIILCMFILKKDKVKVINYDGYSIVDLNTRHKKYFLFEDREYIYYIKGNPNNIYYVTGDTSLIDLEEIKNGNYKKCITENNKGKCYEATNLTKHIYMNLGLPEGLENNIKIYKKDRSKVSIDINNYEINSYEGKYLYYKDMNDIKLYLNNMNEYMVLNINKQYKLSNILKNNKVSLDDLYSAMRYEYDGTKLYYEDSLNNIDCILYDKNKMKICRFYDNELYYEITMLIND